MTKLSDTQALILSAAAQRPKHIALPLPESLRGGAAAKVVGAMLAKGFLQEVDADLRKGAPVWRETGDGHGVTLVATDAGFTAIGIETEDANPAPTGASGVRPSGACSLVVSRDLHGSGCRVASQKSGPVAGDPSRLARQHTISARKDPRTRVEAGPRPRRARLSRG